MICRLCLKTVKKTINIFDETGITLNVAIILSKYFWFEPRSDDPISTTICHNCWLQVSSFHEFYLTIEEAHRLLTERFTIRKKNSVPINVTTNSQTISTELKIEQTKFEDIEQTITEEQSEVDVDLTSIIDETSPDQETTISVKERHQEVDNEGKTTSEVETMLRRITRSTAQKQSENNTTKLHKKGLLKARGRPPKNKTKIEERNFNKDYNRKMHAIDEKIACHMKLLCDICNIEEETFLKLCKHMMQMHRKKGYAVCCNKKFHKRSFLTDHIDKHNNPDKFKCEDCGKSFSDKQCLRNHELLKHQPEEEMTFHCEHCPKKFARSYLLDQHRITHEERTIPCNMCKRRFPNESLLSTHIKMVHTDYGSTMCDICAKVIRGRAAFTRHQLEHSGVTMPKVQCNICGSWHKNKYALQRHITRHNISNEKHVCSICGKTSPNRGALLSHQRYVHISERKYKCSVCQKAFKKPVNLKEHMALHTGEVLYKCPYCPKTFNSNANMHSHRKKVHPKEFNKMRQDREKKRSLLYEQQQAVRDNESNGFSDKIITIKTPDDGKTHRILVTTGSLNANDVQTDVYTL